MEGKIKNIVGKKIFGDLGKTLDQQTVDHPMYVEVSYKTSLGNITSVQWSVAFTMGGTSWCEMEA